MNRTLFSKLRDLWRAEFLSPKDLVQRAAVLAIVFGIAHVCGLRDYTSVLNGTIGSTETSWGTSAFFGVAYILLYLAWVLAVPTLLLAAGILVAWRNWISRRTSPHESRSRSSPEN